MRALAVLGVLAGLAVVLVEAQPSASFTAAQADAGRAAYEANCSACHLRDLKGSNEAAQLAGANFLNQWGDKTVADLHALSDGVDAADQSRAAPGSQAMLDIVAYLLQANGGVCRIAGRSRATRRVDGARRDRWRACSRRRPRRSVPLAEAATRRRAAPARARGSRSPAR